jgi:hypothetical protein
MTGIKDVREGVADYRTWACDPQPRIPYGIPFVDQATNGGMARSEISQIMAFSSVGKTTIALNIIRNNPSVPVLFNSLEMSWRMVVVRIAAMEYGVSTRYLEEELKAGRVPVQLIDVADRFPHLICDDTPALSYKAANDSFKRAADRIGLPPRIVIWDYLELIGGAGMLGKAEQVDRTAQQGRDWTREHDTHSIFVHQVGKGDSGGDVPLSMDSGRYGGFQPFDCILGAYAPRLERGMSQTAFDAVRDELYIQLLKNRAGQSQPVGVKHRLDHQTLRLDPWSRPQPRYTTQGVL